ncbi:hypothetical protein VP01_195g10 [Puccinia sorghi]|uniref:Putative peroxiredoxin n=1 Tax=Puccinia sorghi TaxID=27349 RepID=A0A0L6VC50_9BASI|nr:hypothetical protein VP01_195g10 [Puccinia sorghi]
MGMVIQRSSRSLIRSFTTSTASLLTQAKLSIKPVNKPLSFTTSTASTIRCHPLCFQAKAQYTTNSKNMPDSLKVGDSIPSGTLSYIPYTPELSSPTVCGNAIDLKTDHWKGKKIVLFGVPACSNNHLPGYIQKAKELKSKGISGIYCIASNDPFVMSGWGRLHGSNEHVEMISDSTLKWLEEAGLTVDLSSHGLGKRANRFALVLDDLKVTYVGIEEAAGSVTVSGAEAVLSKL